MFSTTSHISQKRKRYIVRIECDGKEEELVIIAKSPADMKQTVNKLYWHLTVNSLVIITYEESDLL